MRKKKKVVTKAGLKRDIKGLEEQVAALRELRNSDSVYMNKLRADYEAKLADKTNHLLPQQQLILKELSYLVNATSKAVRTTMWALKPPAKSGW